MKIYKNKSLLMCFLSIVVCFVHFSYEYASNGLSPVDEMWQSYCTFNGILKDETRWSEEFKMLEESDDHPNFQTMCDKLSIFMAMPNETITKCPSLKKYLSELVKYYVNNKSITKEVRDIIDYILQNKLLMINEIE